MKGPSDRGEKGDLPLQRTLFEITQKSQEPSVYEVMDVFALSNSSFEGILVCKNLT